MVNWESGRQIELPATGGGGTCEECDGVIRVDDWNAARCEKCGNAFDVFKENTRSFKRSKSESSAFQKLHNGRKCHDSAVSKECMSLMAVIRKHGDRAPSQGSVYMAVASVIEKRSPQSVCAEMRKKNRAVVVDTAEVERLMKRYEDMKRDQARETNDSGQADEVRDIMREFGIPADALDVNDIILMSRFVAESISDRCKLPSYEKYSKDVTIYAYVACALQASGKDEHGATELMRSQTDPSGQPVCDQFEISLVLHGVGVVRQLKEKIENPL